MKPTILKASSLGFRAGHFKEVRKYRVYRSSGTADWLLIHTLSGTGYFRYPEGNSTATVGTTVIIPAGLPHDYGLVRQGVPWEIVWAHFYPRPEWGTLLDWPTLSSGLRTLTGLRPPLAKAVKNALLEMNRAYQSSRPHRVLAALNAMELALLLLDEANPASLMMRRDQRVRAAMDHISDGIGRVACVREIAARVGLSESRLSHLFKEETGMTVIAFIEKTRLARARDYLELTARPVREIAALTGYQDALYFSKRFRREFGLSPRAYRLRHR